MTPRRPTAEVTERLSEMRWILGSAERALVLTHDNPDPDAIASAAGLAFLIERISGIPVTVAFGGIIGRAENRSLMEELDVPFERLEGLEIEPGTAIALVDTQPGSGNNSLPAGQAATVVLDHHPARQDAAKGAFVDIRPDYGASASMIVEYLRAARLEPDRKLATALFYGIQTETMDLGRETSEADVAASVFLYPRTDPAAISRIRHARVPRGVYRSIHEGLKRAWSRGDVVFVPLGRLEYPDLVAQLADLFLKVHGVDWVIAAGLYQDRILISVRAYRPDAHAGQLVQQVVGERGSAGGHGEMAGARLDLEEVSEPQVERMIEGLFDEFATALGVDDQPAESLISGSTGPVEGS
ncbi:MAG: DHH family phosphoesterase [Candidatus Palauibacterales bacterium]|nr:DHH family phosphoesterase [Candidatus Palauibacterales bacterium]MDP2482283.1 DHH family phosphoesterase [Candidatus Palauibacterales bacterium]